jgi:hypothetical protein
MATKKIKKSKREKEDAKNLKEFSEDSVNKQLLLKRLKYSKQIIRQNCLDLLKSKNITEIGGIPIQTCSDDKIFRAYQREFKIDPLVEYAIKTHEKRVAVETKIEQSLQDAGEYVYFFINRMYQFCKIGFSSNISSRIATIQTGCPFPLEIAGVFDGDMRLERKFHEAFREYNTNGEWFKIEGKLRAFINDNFYL